MAIAVIHENIVIPIMDVNLVAGVKEILQKFIIIVLLFGKIFSFIFQDDR